ncbi:hypothetical protein ScPMuIL_009575 [Solemya velum]
MAASMRFMPGGAEEDFDDDFVFGDENHRVSEDTYSLSYVSSGRGGFGHPPAKTKKEPTQPTPPKPKLKPRSLTLDDFKMAVMKGNLETMAEFLEKGMLVDSILKCGWTGLMYAASTANFSVVTFLLEAGADANFHCDMYTVLMAACSSTVSKEDNVFSCVCGILDHGADPDAHDRYHMTPVMYAAREGHVKVVDKLLEREIDINRQDSRGWTALTWSIFKGHKQVVKTLLKGGANPKLKHCDGQTAMDQAQITANEDIIDILGGTESRPTVTVTMQPVIESSNNTHPSHLSLPSRPSSSQSTTDREQGYIKYGELELFLCGLELGSFVYKFQEQHVDFPTFLRMTDDDFIKMGIQQIGVRKKLLDGIQAVHKKEWEKSSLPSILYNKHISCAEAVAMVANISKHSRYMGSCIGFVKDQLLAHPFILEQIQEGSGPKQLQQHTTDAVKNIQGLQKELGHLQEHLSEILKQGNYDPPDIIKLGKVKKRRINYWKLVGSVGLTVTVVCTCVWKSTTVVNKFTSFLHR